MSSKRRHSSPEEDSDDDELSSYAGAGASAQKALRPNEPIAGLWKCSLPPTCMKQPRTFTTAEAFEAHWNTFHSFICDAASLEDEDARCNRVFPDARFLQLHQKECHDPLVAIRRDAGERTYECFLDPGVCGRKFRTVKGRRLHLISKHGYPPEFFFAIVLFGIERIAQRGQALLRRGWKKEEHQSSTSPEPEPEPALAFHEKAPKQSSAREVDDLASTFESSVSMVPRSVRLKNAKNKEKDAVMQE